MTANTQLSKTKCLLSPHMNFKPTKLWETHMSTQQRGFKVPSGSTTLYVLGDVHNTESLQSRSGTGLPDQETRSFWKVEKLTFVDERELVGVVKSEHFLMTARLIDNEVNIRREHEDGQGAGRSLYSLISH